MAISLTDNGGKLLYVDGDGIISTTGLFVKEFYLVPDNAADAVTIMTWNETATPKSTATNATATVTDTKTITSTGNFTATKVAVGDVIKITNSNSKNIGTYSVATRDSDNAITGDGYPAMTNEASKVYSWKIWTPTRAYYMKTGETEVQSVRHSFDGQGMYFDNLFVDGLTSGAVLYIIVG